MERSTTGVAARLKRDLLVTHLAANIVGALVVALLAVGIAPLPHERDAAGQIELNLALGLAYLLAALVVGVGLGFRRLGRLRDWLLYGIELSAKEKIDLVLRAPRRLSLESGGLWAGAVVVFGCINLPESTQVAITVAAVVAFGGAVTCSVVYLLAEWALREAAALVLSSDEPDRALVQSVATRQVSTWVFSTGLPVVGLLAIGIAIEARAPHLQSHLPRTVVALSSITLAVGLLATSIAAKATSDPVEALSQGMDRIRRGDLEASVAVYDGTQLGLLQAGFNRMARGLEERERLADLFGRHVGVEVARQAQERGVQLGGEIREVVALFIDLQGSTQMASSFAADQVVALLNRFFGVVVEEVEANGGFVNKFEGDAALAVWGAPMDDPDRCSRALAAATAIDTRLRAELPDVRYGIGVAGGPAVAGNIGSVNRLEYTVIGDPVNEASRLTDLAKQLPSRLAASQAVVLAANLDAPGQDPRWESHLRVQLRGRAAETEVYVPSS